MVDRLDASGRADRMDTAQSLLVSQKGRPLNHAKVGRSLARSMVKRSGVIDKPGTEKTVQAH